MNVFIRNRELSEHYIELAGIQMVPRVGDLWKTSYEPGISGRVKGVQHIFGFRDHLVYIDLEYEYD